MATEPGTIEDDSPCFFPPCGPVVGWRDGEVVRATGIPYGTAERFAPPQPAEPWQEPLVAAEWAPACPQPPVPEADAILGVAPRSLVEDEACLNLSIAMPGDAADGEALPVLVWIHGGSYLVGAGDDFLGDAARLVAEQRIVVVTVTYRLGAFGYLPGDGRPANLGLQDQLLALRWVHENIAAFGGDPDRVTLGGQSAGADAVIHLLMTGLADPLIVRAIAQSPPAGIMRGRAKLNAAIEAAVGVLDEQASVSELLELQPLVEQVGMRFGLKGRMPFATRYGSYPLPAESEATAAWQRAAPRVELLIGSTATETMFFFATMPIIEKLSALPLVGARLRSLIVRYTTKAVYSRGVRRLAEEYRAAGGRALRYLIRWGAPGNVYGAAHAIDLPLLFPSALDPDEIPLIRGARSSEVERHGKRLRAMWGEFIRGERLDADGSIPGLLSFSDHR